MADEKAKKSRKAKQPAHEHAAIERAVTAEQLRDDKGTFTDDLAADVDQKTEAVTHHVKAKVDVFHLVNPAGCVHEVTREHARTRLARGMGWRQASAAEIAEYEKRGGHQTFDAPIAPRWTPEPVAESGEK